MYYSDSCTHPPDWFIDVEPIDLTPPKPSFWREILGIPPKPASTQVREKLEDEQCRALFTKTVLEHVGMLSEQEQRMASTTPQAAARYRVLIDIHTKKMIQEIEEW